MGVVVDSSLFIASERGRFDFPSFLRTGIGTRTTYISSITATELLHGVERAEGNRQRRRRLLVEAVLDDFPVLPFALGEARVHASLWADMKKRGELIGPYDLLIAATALAGNHSLATLNVGEFSRVEGLGMIDASPFAKQCD